MSPKNAGDLLREIRAFPEIESWQEFVKFYRNK